MARPSSESRGRTAERRPFPPDHDECELCQAARFTHWYHEDSEGWVADCEACGVPMVVWWRHGDEPPSKVSNHLINVLSAVADQRFGEGRWSLDRVMRQVPDHFHAHARDESWWEKRWSRPMSRYTGVGGDRQTLP